MSWFARQIQKIIYIDKPQTVQGKASRYRRMWHKTVIAVVAVSILPLFAIIGINYYLYRQSFQKEFKQPIQSIASITKYSVESFVEERIAAAKYVASRERSEDLFDEEKLARILV